MVDETDIESSILEEGLDFAQMITGGDPDPPAADDTPVKEPEKPAEDDTPAKEPEKPAEDEPEKPPVAEDEEDEEDENPFDVVEKPDSEKPSDEDKEPEKPASSDDWSRLRESRNRYKAEAAERESLLHEKEAEVAELKAKAARTAELEEKLKVFDEQEKELAVARVESTREYKETIEAPLKAIGEQVDILATSNEGDVSAVHRMLVEPDPAKQRTMLKEITSGWDEIDRLDLKKMAEDARTILDKQDAMRTNAHAAAKEREQIASQREVETKEKSRKEFINATGEVVKSIREKVPFIPLAEGETEDDRYSSLAQKVAQVDFESQTPRAKALAVASTFALPQAVKTIAAKDKEIAELKEALAKSSKSKPSVTLKADPAPDGEEQDFFKEFGIQDRSNMFGSMSIDVTG